MTWTMPGGAGLGVPLSSGVQTAPGTGDAPAAGRLAVLHVVESFGGGVFTSVTQIVNHLDPAAFDVGLVYSRRPETPSDVTRFVAPWVRVEHVPMPRRIEPYGDLATLARLTRLFRRHRPDVVHLHSSKAGALGRVAARVAGVPRVFYSPRGYAFLRSDVGYFERVAYQTAERLAGRFGGTVLACSRGELEAAQLVAPRAVLVHNAIDLQTIDAVAAGCLVDPGTGRDRVTVAIAGRVAMQRAPELFAAVASAVSARYPGSVRFVWFGGGDGWDGASRLDGAPVEVTGWLPREAVLRRIAAEVDVYLHTSRWEGLPLAVLEAMALGRPVVASDVVGNRDAVLHERTGFLGTTVDDLAAVVSRLVEDGALRSRLGVAGRARVEEEFSLPVLMARLTGLYRGEA